MASIPVVLIVMSFTAKTVVKFMSTDWDTAKNKAFAEGKLYFVDFDASYCATCRNMDEGTYMSQQLASYIDKNVVALRVDVQDFDGVMWSQQYEIEALPTMLIFDEKGKLVKRIVGYQSADQLIKEFKAVKTTNKTATIAKTTPIPVTSDEPLSRPDQIIKTNTSTKTSSRKGGNSFMDEGTNNVIVARGKGLYDVIIKKQSSKGYAIQVGVYTSYQTIMQQASLFKRKYTRKTLIHIDTHNGSTVYKLLLGTFDSKREASAFRKDLRKDGADGLLKDLRYLG